MDECEPFLNPEKYSDARSGRHACCFGDVTGQRQGAWEFEGPAVHLPSLATNLAPGCRSRHTPAETSQIEFEPASKSSSYQLESLKSEYVLLNPKTEGASCHRSGDEPQARRQGREHVLES
ncbi:hypothetical protein MC885_018922 [Smutsia gigantea]|nr:hypothetical protein MC885_018922 [Smutsia gigantea]